MLSYGERDNISDYIIHLLTIQTKVNIFVLCYLLVKLDIINCANNIVNSYLSSVNEHQNDVIALLFIKYESCNIENILHMFADKPYYNSIINIYKNPQIINNEYKDSDPLSDYLKIN